MTQTIEATEFPFPAAPGDEAMDKPVTTLFVAAHDGGYEGHSLPMLAFTTKEQALAWCQVQTESFSVAEVPIYPELPLAEWFRLEKVKFT